MTEDRDSSPKPRYVQVIDLWTGHPAEVERLLNRWCRSALAGERIDRASVRRDVCDDEHVVLQVEFPSPEAALDGAGTEAPELPDSAEAAAVVGLLDRRPRFREAELVGGQ